MQVEAQTSGPLEIEDDTSKPKISKKKAKNISKLIDEQLKRDAKEDSEKGSRLLLLGSGDSGKSTLLKQMKILHADGFSKQERNEFTKRIHENIFDSVGILIKAVNQLELKVSPKNMSLFGEFCSASVYNGESTSSANAIPIQLITQWNNLWNDPATQQCFLRGNEFNLQDNAEYFLTDIVRFFQTDYVPTDDDILRCRVHTTSIIETPIQIKDTKYRVIDVGGQRSLRCYWVPYFDRTVRAIIFISSLASYDQTLPLQEDQEETNRMADSINLFSQIINNDVLKPAAMIVLLNKTDLFEEKVKRSSIKKYFPDYKGDNHSIKQARSFFRTRFVQENKDDKRNIYVHFTNSTDTKLMKFMISAVSDIIVRFNLEGCEINI